jgi:deoxyribodipyrimidine photo-lyase
MIKTDSRRIKHLNNLEIKTEGPVIYWMSRDQRVEDNWALLYAQEISHEKNNPLAVVFCLNPKFLEATIRQYDFMIKGLIEVEKDLNELNISFFLLEGNPEEEIIKFCNINNASALITDFSPLKIGRKWRNKISKEVNCHMSEVDTHNVVPCLYVSDKQEFAAYTIRPKIKKILTEFLTNIPKVKYQPHTIKKEKIDWEKVYNKLDIDFSVKPVDWIQPGYKNGMKMFHDFLKNKIDSYNDDRNNPNLEKISNLSPYLHFGQVSAQRIAYETNEKITGTKKDSFLEELIVRKELADNYCYFNLNYDNTQGFPNWALESHKIHVKDTREYIYSKNEFELAKSHDPLWNAAQLEMVKTGKMHGYLRMYWAKKILEWTETPEDAVKIAIYLNDKYELDGRDPSGYTGIAWSIGGVHDRPWFTHKIFGKIRYMSFNGCKSKFDVDKYIQKINSL